MKIVKKAKLLHVAGTYLMSTFDGKQTAKVLKQAKAAGVTTSLDTAYNDRLKNWLGVIKPSFPHLDYFLPSIEEAERISGKKKPKDMHIILTGRDAAPELIEIADLVTEMREIKHPFKKGIYAQRGIEY